MRSRADANTQKPRAKSTIRAYAADWKRFAEFCRELGASALPADPQTIVDHLTSLAERDPPYKFPTIARAYSSIRVVHQARGHELPRLTVVVNALGNIQKRLTARRVFSKPKLALTSDQVIAACAKLPDTLTGKRDRVVLLFGEAVAQRRADIARIHVEDLVQIPEGFDVIIRQSKTDQRGKGLTVTVNRDEGVGCPVGAVEAWLTATGITSGPIVRRMNRDGKASEFPLSGHGIANIVKRAAASLGLNPNLYGGHSLRRGMVTSASRAGRPLELIVKTTGHRSIAQAMGYIDDSLRAQQSATKGLFATPSSGPRSTSPSSGSRSTPPHSPKPSPRPSGDSQPSSIKASVRSTDIVLESSASTVIADSLRSEPSASDIVDTTATHPTTGQKLVNRRRVASIAYRRDGKPADMKWLRAQVTGLRARKLSDATILQVLLKLGVRRADGTALDASDVLKLECG